MREEVGGLEGRRPEEDEQVHGAFEAAGSQAEGEDLFVDCFQCQYGKVLKSGACFDRPPRRSLRESFFSLGALPLSPKFSD